MIDHHPLPWTTEIAFEGTGPTRVMFVAGYGSGPETLRDLGQVLHATLDATVRLVALAGHTGTLGTFLESRSWQYLREAEERFLRFWSETGTRVHLGGYSTGALVALLIAARHPEKVAALVLVSPALRLASRGKQVIGYTIGSAYYLLLPVVGLGAVLSLLWRRRRHGRTSPRDLTALAGTAVVVVGAALGLRSLTIATRDGGPILRNGEEVLPPHFARASLVGGSSLVPLQLAARWSLERLSLPVCIVFGEADETVDVRFGTLRAARRADTELHVVPGAPHRVVTFEECLSTVRDFVARTRSRA